MSALRSIPSVEKVLQALGTMSLPRPIVLAVVRSEAARARRGSAVESFAAFVGRVRDRLEALERTRLHPVVNATGVIIHTNLGRAPLDPGALAVLSEIGGGYSNLEFDLSTGERGRRAAYLDHALATLCGSETSMVVNNCAAALVLILRHFTSGDRREVVISRGELVQIGGGFRIPEVLEAGGAVLREVGTTNKTSLTDYTRAIGKRTALILKVHRSNFFMGGFVESPSIEELARLSRRQRRPLIEDLGTGAVFNTEKCGLPEREPTPAEELKRGVDLICFSGDKLLGGPQAGVIAGRRRWIGALKREPLFRALRCDKLVLAALEATVDAWLNRGSDLPVLRMLEIPVDQLRVRAERIRSALSDLPLQATVRKGNARVGGGTLPRSVVPTITLDLIPEHIDLAELGRRLRQGAPPIIGYPSARRFRLDLRTVFPEQDETVTRRVREVLSAFHEPGSRQ